MAELGNDLIGLKEFSEVFGFKPSYIYKLVHEKRVNYYKPFGKKLFFKLSELQVRFEESKTEAVSTEQRIKQAADKFMLR